MARFLGAISRANSSFRYWQYRRKIGLPISLLLVLREWPRRFSFEWHNIQAAAERLGGGGS
jgi:hypothetical protein